MAEEQRPEVALVLENNKAHIHLQIRNAGELKAGIVFTAPELESLVASLIDLRAQMLPEIPTQFDESAKARQIAGTHFDFAVDDRDSLIFSLRDPGLGWLSLKFTARLLERMLKIAQSARRAPQTKQ